MADMTIGYRAETGAHAFRLLRTHGGDFEVEIDGRVVDVAPSKEVAALAAVEAAQDRGALSGEEADRLKQLRNWTAFDGGPEED